MRRIEKVKLKVVWSDTPDGFEEEFNSVMEAKAPYDPEYEFKDIPHQFCAYVTWTERETITEIVEDEFHLQGIKRQCKDCPYFDADPDGRVITGDCPELGRKVRRDKPACELYYKRLKDGVI